MPQRFSYVASFGYGGQNLCVVPEYDLSLVFTCELAGENSGVDTLIDKAFTTIIR